MACLVIGIMAKPITFVLQNGNTVLWECQGSDICKLTAGVVSIRSAENQAYKYQPWLGDELRGTVPLKRAVNIYRLR